MDTTIKRCKCGKWFESPRWANRKYCSHLCITRYRVPHKAQFKSGMIPWNKGKKMLKPSYRKGRTWNEIWGENKATKMKNRLRDKKYTGKSYLDKKGYYRIRSPTTGKQFPIHQWIWMKNNSIPYIPDGYCVHHIDGNKINNHKNNLLLIDLKTHNKLHSKIKALRRRNK